jgi:hypothetical protein
MNRRHTLALALITAAAGFALGRITLPATAMASPAEGAGAPAGIRTMVGFQFVPAAGERTKDLLIRGWDTGDIDYVDVSRQPRDEDPVRYLWTETAWRFISQYSPPPGR